MKAGATVEVKIEEMEATSVVAEVALEEQVDIIEADDRAITGHKTRC